jgi:hypothetical protein
MLLIFTIILWIAGCMFTEGFTNQEESSTMFFSWPKELGKELRKRLDL